MSIQLSFDLRTDECRSDDAEIPIDQDFPEQSVTDLSKRESFNKHLYRPNTYLHKWWARRSGTTFRYILKQLVSDPGRRGFYEPGGLEGTVILDPMMGGGTTLHEAIRLGASVIGIDIDPIPVVQARATLTIVPVSHKKAVFQGFFDALLQEIGPFYRTVCGVCGREAETQFVLYGLRRRCSCREVLFVDSLLLRENRGKDIYICTTCQAVYSGHTHDCYPGGHRAIVEKGTRVCERCGTEYKDILDEPFRDRYVPLVIVGKCAEHGQFYKAVDSADLEVLAVAKRQIQQVYFGSPLDFQVPPGPKSTDLLARQVSCFTDLFTPRQLLYLHTSKMLLSQLSSKDRLWLSLLVSTSLDFNCLLCGYKGSGIRRPGAIRHVFSHHAYTFPYTALENNPLFSERRSGTLMRLFSDRVLKAGKWAVRPVETYIKDDRQTKVQIRGEVDGGEATDDWAMLPGEKRRFMVIQQDASALQIPEGIVDFVVTDPPYYDSVQYSDLSHFFRVWLHLFLPQEADWHYDPLASAVSEGGSAASQKYGQVLGRIWERCHEALDKERGRLIFTFHHWNHEAWAELTLSLKKAQFVLVNRWVVFSENPTSVHIRQLRALKHDTILVLKPWNGSHGVPAWDDPDWIDTTDSYSFCRDCAAALGWFLENDLEDQQIRAKWQSLLDGEGDG